MTYKAYKKGILQRLQRMDDGVDTNDETKIAIKTLHVLYQAGLQAWHMDTTVDLGPDPTFDDSGEVDFDSLVAEYVELPLDQFEMHHQAIQRVYDVRYAQRKPVVDVG